ncbi:hypothetical protein K443DRAFT_105821 [Laccaria amethystina LaAM-08-1]|uniref:Uncharacterized protein n=1 Tax=Laccaria amethystina LaAM-08-1 TaxID=1095629 RepID=A0A0C9XMR0_9AGAR|nr:hypothetical protein K443DRAFT_105821 [Laccaria amethystina LaAM-08-1]
MCTGHVNTTPTLSTIVHTMFILPRKHYSNIVNNNHVNTTPKLSTTVYIRFILFFSFSPDFLTIFALLTILGNVHRPCKQHPILQQQSTSCLSFFSPFFLIFWLYLHYLPYLEICTDHVNSTLTTSLHHPYFFF